MDRESQLSKDDEEDEEEEERRRRRRRRRRRKEEEKEDEEATDIKSNNPHLAGGEKYTYWIPIGYCKQLVMAVVFRAVPGKSSKSCQEPF